MTTTPDHIEEAINRLSDRDVDLFMYADNTKYIRVEGVANILTTELQSFAKKVVEEIEKITFAPFKCEPPCCESTVREAVNIVRDLSGLSLPTGQAGGEDNQWKE